MPSSTVLPRRSGIICLNAGQDARRLEEMEKRLTQEELGKVVAEVTRLAQERQDFERATLDRQQMAQVLKELDLPVELIDDAMEQVNRREALAREQRKRKRIIAFGIAALVLIIFLFGVWAFQRGAAFDRINTDQARITRSIDDGGSLQTVLRDGQDVFYRVILKDVPVGETLSITCNWIDPSGRVFYQNRYTTRATDKSVWPTQCRCQLGSAAERGAWKVEMLLEDRVLSSTTFQVE